MAQQRAILAAIRRLLEAETRLEAAERRARHVVCRAFAMTLLVTMAACRPPPPFEVHECINAFVIDQTYARTGGCGTGSSNYRPVETLGDDGERRVAVARS